MDTTFSVELQKKLVNTGAVHVCAFVHVCLKEQSG